MAVHQAAMRHTGPHGVDTHSMGTFIGRARSLIEMGKTREDKKPGTNTLLQHVYMGRNT